MFVNLNVHTVGTLMGSIIKIDDLISRLKELGQNACAITDKGNLFKSIEFYKKMKKAGIKPILGVEFDIVDDMSIKDSKYTESITLLAENNSGWTNLKKLVTIANKDGFYYKPRIDYKSVAQHKDGLIVLSGGVFSKPARMIVDGKDDAAEQFILESKSVFGENYYIELCRSGYDSEELIIRKLRDISNKLNVPCVCTSDTRYLFKEDSYCYEVMTAISSNKMMDDPNRRRPQSDRLFLKSSEDIEEWANLSEMYTSVEIAERCNVDINFDFIHLPKFDRAPSGVSNYDYLRQLLYDGMKLRGIDRDNKIYVDRIKRELNDIKEAGIVDYFLMVYDIIRWCKENDIFIGLGRGSAAGSLISYFLNITQIDPIQYGLIWERFYNIGRKGSMADIDIDIEIERREDVLKYVEETYGINRVCQMVTFGTLSIKNTLKDVGRVFGISIDEMQAITDEVPHKSDSIKDAVSKSDRLKEYYKTHKKIFVIAEKLEDGIRNTSKHAAGVIISDENIYETGCIPLSYDTKSKKMISGFDMYAMDDLKYMKLDLLGLKTLSVIKLALSIINEEK